MTPATPDVQMRQARAAQALWAARPMKDRARMLRGVRREIVLQRHELIDLIVRETGKPPLDALGGDVLVTLEHTRFYERHAAKTLRARRVGKPALLYPGARFYEQYEPHGVALIFAPANYPLQLAMVPAITALYAGNAVILKCSEQTPETARAIERLCRDAQLPEGLVQVSTEGPEVAGAYIDARPDIVFFTGSAENGRSVAARAGALMIPTVMELGGKDAAVVFEDCDLERTIEGVTYGAFAHAGQVCVGIKRLYVQQMLYLEFLDRLRARMAGLRVGDGSGCDFGTMRSEKGRARLAEEIEDAIARGAKLEFPERPGSAGSQPVLLSSVPPAARLLTEDTFGPVLCIAPFEDEEHAATLANASPFALGASVWTRDLERGRRVAAELHVGSCAVNDVIRNIANPHAAFGGNGMSGYGRYHGAAGLVAFSRVKSVMVSSGARRRERHWFPLTEKTYRGLSALIGFRHRPARMFAALRSVFALLLISALLLAAGSAQDAGGHLQLNVKLPRGARGQVAYLVFASKDGFPQDPNKALRHAFVAQSGETLVIDAGPLPPGRYAVSAYLDENGNRRLDAGILGIPREPVGVSKHPKMRFGPPRFDDCAFTMGTHDKAIDIVLVRP